MIAGDDATRARHVCHGERRVTRDETSEMADENSRIYVGTAARRKADDDPHDFAAIEIRYGALIDIHAAAFRRQSWSRRAGEQENKKNTFFDNYLFSHPPFFGALNKNSGQTILKTSAFSAPPIPTAFFPPAGKIFSRGYCWSLQIDAQLL